MSGGSLCYFFSTLQEHVGDFGDKELDDLVKDLADLFHDREWYLSGDTGIGDWREARDAFKSKWFTEHGRHERIEKYLGEVIHDIRDEFGVLGNYTCKTCRHWHRKQDSERFGTCDYEKYCLMHQSEDCEKYEPREGDCK